MGSWNIISLFIDCKCDSRDFRFNKSNMEVYRAIGEQGADFAGWILEPDRQVARPHPNGCSLHIQVYIAYMWCACHALPDAPAKPLRRMHSRVTQEAPL